jgi:hypothetical protein
LDRPDLISPPNDASSSSATDFPRRHDDPVEQSGRTRSGQVAQPDMPPADPAEDCDVGGIAAERRGVALYPPQRGLLVLRAEVAEEVLGPTADETWSR